MLAPVLCVAHGELEPGPHGGEMRMPGAFHVEVVASNVGITVYLLDMQFKNPKVANSSVNVVLLQEGEQLDLDCNIDDDEKMFKCVLPKGQESKTGRLLVHADRDGQPSAPVHYELPLNWGDTKSSLRH